MRKATPAIIAMAIVGAVPASLGAVITTLNGKSYLQYQYNFSDTTAWNGTYNAFATPRTYFAANFRLTPDDQERNVIKGRTRFDVKPISDLGYSDTAGNWYGSKLNGYYMVFLKHAYIELKDPVPGLNVKFGMSDLPWVPREEDIWTFRVQGTVMPDRNGYLSSTDLGLGLNYVTPNKVLDAQVNFVNGEGYHGLEGTGGKDVHAYVGISPLAAGDSPLKGLKLHGFYKAGDVVLGDTVEDGKSVAIGALSFQHSVLTFMGEYMMTATKNGWVDGSGNTVDLKGTGISVFGSTDLLGLKVADEEEDSGFFTHGGLFGRYDMNDRNTGQTATATGEETNRIIGGVWFTLHAKAKVLLGVDMLSDGAPGWEASGGDNRFLLQTELKF